MRFETLTTRTDARAKSSGTTWPYMEGLRLDEAMHDLTLLATGLYGKELLPQNGAPIRLVVPWKYGFKSIKSIVKIELVEEMPTSLWMAAAPMNTVFMPMSIPMSTTHAGRNLPKGELAKQNAADLKV